MWRSVHPFQKQFCVLFVSAAILTFFLSIKYKNNKLVKKQLFSQEISNDTYTELDEYFKLLEKNDSQQLNYFLGIDNNKTSDFDFKTIAFNFSESIDVNITENKSKVLHILGLFELSTRYGKRMEGVSEMMAAQLAVNHINKFNILPGYKINLLINDTMCDPGVGVDRFFHALYSKKTIMMLLGTGCSNVTESLAHIVPYWNILQVSFGSTSPSLSDRNKFPLFFRTVAPDTSYNNAKIHFVKEFGWKVVATFSQSENAYLLPLNHLVTDLEKVNVSCISTVTFSSDNYRDQLKVLKDLDTRIIFASFSSDMAANIFCTVYEQEMYGEDYVWIMQDLEELWWERNKKCSNKILKEAVEGLILVSSYNNIINNKISIGLDDDNFEVALNVSRTNISKYAKEAYDAVWAMALTLRKVQEHFWFDDLHDFHYKRKDMVCNFLNKMTHLNFIGLSGPVKFNGADRIGNSIFKQIQGGKIANIAVFDSVINKLSFNCSGCKPIFWPNGKVPIDQRRLKIVLVKIPDILFTIMVTISILGMIASLLFLYFNLRFRRMKTVKLSSPKLNNVTVIGCILVYSSVILLGFYNFSIKSKIYFGEMCIVRVYLLSAGCSLTFGSMFAKTYRVHRLFTYIGAGLVKDKLLKDKQLIALILVPLVIDGIILSLWSMIDPMERNLHNLTLEISSRELGVVYQPQVEVCRSHNTYGWYIALYGYKGIFLIMGVFMAWETRHVKVPGLNDSQYIGICVYSAVFSAIVVVLSSFISQYVILSYLAKSISILTSTTLTLFLLFLPKLKSVFGKLESDDPIMQSMGLKVECNTRRFITNDPNELISRLEIQNKIYKYELEALDKEILRLEELIIQHSSLSTININLGETNAQCYYLKVPSPVISRASWPNARTQHFLSKPNFHSDNKLNKESFFDRFNFFGKLKYIFGSIPSLQVSKEVLSDNYLYQVKPRQAKLSSNPEVNSRMNTYDGTFVKALSENNINIVE